jgi:hypothetical protein
MSGGEIAIHVSLPPAGQTIHTFVVCKDGKTVEVCLDGY